MACSRKVLPGPQELGDKRNGLNFSCVWHSVEVDGLGFLDFMLVMPLGGTRHRMPLRRKIIDHGLEV